MERKGIFDRIIDFMAFLAGVLLVCTVLIVCLEIFMRYFVHRPQVWSVEVCEYFLFGIAFFGAPWLLKRGGHVNVDVVIEHMGEKGQNYMRLLAAATGIIISAIICWFSLVTSWECYSTGVIEVKTLSVPKHYFLIVIFLGYLLLLFEFARQFFKHLRAVRRKE